MNENQRKEIKNIIEKILSKMNVSGIVSVVETIDGINFVIKTEEAGILIGENGQNLDALSHVIRKICHKYLNTDEENDPVHFFVDVNDYLAKKIEDLKVLAKMNAQKAIYFKKDIEMEPMPANERRIIHSVLTEHPNIKTESFGTGYLRRVVIKPLIEIGEESKITK